MLDIHPFDRRRSVLDHQVSNTTLQAHHDEWIEAVAFDELKSEALAAFDRITGLDVENVAICLWPICLWAIFWQNARP